MPEQSPKRGAIPSPRSALAAAAPYSAPSEPTQLYRYSPEDLDLGE